MSLCFHVFFYSLFFFKQKTAYEMRISDWSSDVCSSDLREHLVGRDAVAPERDGLRARDLVRLVDELAPTLDVGDGAVADGVDGAIERREEIGRASCRERVCQYV